MSSENIRTIGSALVLTPEVLGEGIVTLYVGPKRKKLEVLKKVLCDQTNFFSAAFKTSYKEMANGEMYMPEDDPNTVASLINYLYRGVIILTKVQGRSETVGFIRLYILAEKLCITDLMDQTMDALRSFLCKDGKRLGKASTASIACFVAYDSQTLPPNWAEQQMSVLRPFPDFFQDFFHFHTKYSQIIPRKWPNRPVDSISPSHKDPITVPTDPRNSHAHSHGEDCSPKIKDNVAITPSTGGKTIFENEGDNTKI